MQTTKEEAAKATIADLLGWSDVQSSQTPNPTKNSPGCLPTDSEASPQYLPTEICPLCGGQKWLIRDLPVGDPNFGKAVPCPCATTELAARRMARLDAMDGLTEQERSYTFDNALVMPGSATEKAVNATRSAIEAGCGLITLSGGYGVGKTRTLVSAVNYAKSLSRPAVYTRMRDLLTWLRGAFDPNSQETYLQRWDLLNDAPVLAIDELDKANATPWALEQFSALIDNRWRNLRTQITILGLNTSPEQLPGDIADRILDGRATVINFTGESRRPYLKD